MVSEVQLFIDYDSEVFEAVDLLYLLPVEFELAHVQFLACKLSHRRLRDAHFQP